MKFSIPAAVCAGVLFSVLAVVPAGAGPAFGSYGAVTVQGGNFDLVSDPAGVGYAGLYYDATPPNSLTVGGLTNLSANYSMTAGNFGGGSPRFSLSDNTNNLNNEAYVYFGLPQAGGTFSNPSPNNVF